MRGRVCISHRERVHYLPFSGQIIVTSLFSLTGMMLSKGNHPKMAVFQVSEMGMGQNLVPLVNIKIAGNWMFIPLKMVCIGIDP